MNILWLTTVFDDSAVSNILLQILPYFPSSYCITVVSIGSIDTSRSKVHRKLKDMGIAHVSLESKKFQLFRIVKKLNSLIHEIQPSIIHAQLGIAYLALLQASDRHSYKRFATFHNNADYFNKLTSMALSLLFHKFDAISAVSLSALKTIQSSFDKRQLVPSRVIYNPIALFDSQENKSPIPDFAETTLQERVPVLLTIGRLVSKKGHDLWINMIPHLQRLFIASKSRNSAHAFKLWCAGSGPLASSLQSKCKKLQAEEFVEFLGYRYDVPQLITQADIVLFPSQNEGFGLVPCESILLGVPVLVHDIPVMHEILQDDFWITDCTNPEMFARKIYEILQHYGHYKELVSITKAKLQQVFSPSTIALEYQKFYSDLM